ncbi:MAG: pilus assembly PilX N-terminal domain-containing protein [Elusimicrobia bacterium]|nr:pilus assembly PilX N-terminal domain-containing protein [Elusimicrobiota bacterium]
MPNIRQGAAWAGRPRGRASWPPLGRMSGGRGGQILVGVIVIMLILAVLVPTMVMYVQNESKWSMKQTRNMTAFQIAEAGVDRGFRKISESTTTWASAMAGTFPTGYLFTQAFDDLDGGCYAVAISSGPEEEQVTVISVSTHTSKKESRAIQAVYENAPMGDTAIYARSGVAVAGRNVQVEWGAVVTAKSIDMNGRLWPQRWTSAGIDLDTNGNEWPNCDQPACVGWHSYEINIPEDPGLDTDGFLQDAVSSNTYFFGNQAWGAPSTQCNNATLCKTDKTYYIQGNLDVTNSMYVQGALVVTGNVSMDGGNKGAGEEWCLMPRSAWQQYGLDDGAATAWNHYKDEEILKVNCAGGTSHDPVDSTAPANFPGINSGYKSPATAGKCIDKIVVKGLMYVGGNLIQTGGGGNTNVVGAMYVVGDVSVGTNNITVWYDQNAGDWIKTTSVILSRKSWKDLPSQKWPTQLSCNH